MANTIVLLYGQTVLTNKEREGFEKGDTVFGEWSCPEEVMRWSIDHEKEAMEELARHKCTYSHWNLWYIEEWALEYCECDSDGEWVDGSDYVLAEEVKQC